MINQVDERLCEVPTNLIQIIKFNSNQNNFQFSARMSSKKTNRQSTNQSIVLFHDKSTPLNQLSIHDKSTPLRLLFKSVN